jgi:transposase
VLEAAIDYKEKYEVLYMEHINLRHELEQLKRLVFGSRHERFVPATPQEQLALGLEAARSSSQPISPAQIQTIEYTRTKKASTEKVNTGRMKLPADLPREEVLLEPDQDVVD